MRRQARIAAGEAEDGGRRRILDASEIGGRQHIVEGFLLLVGADEVFAAIGWRDDLELMRLRKISARRAIGVDDTPR